MTNKEKLEKAVKLADGMYYAAQYLTTDASRLHKAMEEYHQFIINDYCKEELANEELDRAAYRYANCTANLDARETRFRGFTTGAQWQREQMINNAIDAIIDIIYTPTTWLPDIVYDTDKLKDLCKDKFEQGDRVKVIIFKE